MHVKNAGSLVNARARSQTIGFWTALALVVGNIIGSGIFLLPATLAPFAANSVVAWLFTAAGAIVLAFVFAQLSRGFPHAGGPYVFLREAFGPFAAFIVAWGYWVAIPIGNAAIATGAVSYLTPLFPSLRHTPGASVWLTLGALWILTAVNLRGIKASGAVQTVTTLLKLVPLLGIALCGFFFLSTARVERFAGEPFSMHGVTASATLAWWALVGFEAATIPANKVRDPSRTIPRATLVGTLLTALICAAACTVVLISLPASELAASNAPFADAAKLFWGEPAALAVAAFAALSGFGCLNGWILMQAELPHAMAKSGVFPRAFAHTSSRGVPSFGMVFGSLMVTALIAMNYQKSMVSIFQFMILLATIMSLVLYFMCSMALLRLRAVGKLPRGRAWQAMLPVVGAAYALWAIVGAGWTSVGWGLVLLIAGVPIFWMMQRQ